MVKILVLDGPLYQWDTGRKAQITPNEGTSIEEVHFSYSRSTCALVTLPELEDGALTVSIPNTALQAGGVLTVYAVTLTEDGRHTKHSKSFQIAARAKPEDYVYTEEEIRMYTRLEERINQIEENGVSDEQIETAVNAYLEEHPVGGVTPEELDEAVTEALQEAKDSGAFKGDKGERGETGATGATGSPGIPGETGPAGEPGYSPSVKLTRQTDGVLITVTNKDGSQSEKVYDGEDGTGGSGEGGADGKDGVTFTPAVSAECVLSWTNDGGLTNPDPVNIKGDKGDTGDDGFTPTVKLTRSTSGSVTISVTNKNGTSYESVYDGEKGDPGEDGTPCTHKWDGTTLSITSGSGTSSADLKGGKGDKGDTGDPGVSCTHSWDGTTLSITSASGTTSADLKGDKGDKGDTGDPGHTPVKGTDYWTAEDKATMVQDVLDAMTNASGVSF